VTAATQTPAQDRCQRWLDGRHSWRHPSEGGFDARRFDVVPLAGAREKLGTSFVQRHHYAQENPVTRLVYGLVTDDDQLAVDGAEVDGRAMVGVAVLSVPMNKLVVTNVFPDLEPYAESLELGRFVLTDTPANAESWFLGRVWEHAADAGIRGVVSFSDPMPRHRTVLDVDHDGRQVERREVVTPGHVGLIYQATNGYACGRSTPRTLTYLPRHGYVVSDRTMQKVRKQERGAAGFERRLVAMGARARRAGEQPTDWLRSVLVDMGATKVRHPGDYRYAWRIGGRVERRKPILVPRTGYPKPDTGRAPALSTRPATEQLALV
jgi:hypothetical protein